MTREQAEKIARSVLTAVNADTSWPSVNHVANAIMEAVAIERADEREACAKVCEERYPENYGGVITEHPCYASSNECAKAIRARGE